VVRDLAPDETIKNKKEKKGGEDTTVCVRSWKARFDFKNVNNSTLILIKDLKSTSFTLAEGSIFTCLVSIAV
jgi:hypothetical protein